MPTIEQTQLNNEELERKVSEQENRILELENKIKEFEKTFTEHGHTGNDKSLGIKGNIQLEDFQYITIGNAIFSGASVNKGTPTEQNFTFINTGGDRDDKVLDVTKNTQIVTDDTPSGLTFFYGQKSPVVVGTGISIVSGTSTLNDSTKKFVVNELAGAYINISAVGSIITETLVIASNTESSITVTGTFSTDISNAAYVVFDAVYLGAANYPWKRLYTTDTNAGGLRFGQGPTNGGQNSLLYTVGDRIYFRDTSGTVNTLAFTSELPE
jgi:hypothetical protein